MYYYYNPFSAKCKRNFTLCIRFLALPWECHDAKLHKTVIPADKKSPDLTLSSKQAYSSNYILTLCAPLCLQAGTRGAYLWCMKTNKFELKSDGTIEKVGPFGAYGPTVEAANKTEAAIKFLEFAYRASENTPRVKVKNGAWQLAYETLGYGIAVEAGTDERAMALCCSGEKDWQSLTDKTASFDYYASEGYRAAKRAEKEAVWHEIRQHADSYYATA